MPPPKSQPRRIMIIGPSGSGKTWLATRLGQSLGLPVIHIDKFYFHPGWVQRDRAETAALATLAADAPDWVLEGNNSASMDHRAERADLIIYLDLGRVRRLARCVWRSARWHGRTRPDMAQGCPERFDHAFLFDWVWNYASHSEPRMQDFLGRWQGRRPILRLGSARAVRRLARDPASALAGIETRATPRYSAP